MVLIKCSAMTRRGPFHYCRLLISLKHCPTGIQRECIALELELMKQSFIPANFLEWVGVDWGGTAVQLDGPLTHWALEDMSIILEV